MRSLIVLALACMISFGVHGQQTFRKSKREVYKIYETRESGKDKNKNSVLIFFNDNTFINYGLGATSCWYTSGRWLGNHEMYMCRTYAEIKDTLQLVKEIKEVHIPQQKNFIIPPDLSFVKIEYKDYIFQLSKNDVYDKVKKVYYYQRNPEVGKE